MDIKCIKSETSLQLGDKITGISKKKKHGFTHESTYNESKEWYTPRYIFDALNVRFDMDVCSPGADMVPWIPADRHLTILDDGLTHKWDGFVFVNPPYGMDTPKWMKRLSVHGNGIALVFSRTDTNWFHDYAAKADAILFIAKRVQFIPASQAELYAKGIKVKNSGSGAGSRAREMVRDEENSAGGRSVSHESLPSLPETGQLFGLER